jgi:adenylyltransferase/sulfurtransferase
VLGILPGIVGLIQATEAIKIILGEGDPLVGRLLVFDALKMKFRQMKIKRNRNCPVCGDHPTVTELIDYKQFCGVPDQPTDQTPDKAAAMEKQSDYDMTPTQLKQELDAGEDLVILDVRKPHEYDICNLGGTLIPLQELPGRLDELDEEDNIVVHCRSGARSAQAVDILRSQGFENVRNLQGGILAWADQVDPSVPKY